MALVQSEQYGSHDDYTIEIPQPTEEVEPEKRPECCIYKVPQKLREVNPDAYTPKLITIGPFNHHIKNLKMEELKYRYFWDACARTKKSKEELSGYIKKIGYKKILHCYADVNGMSEKDFMTMTLLDFIFIIEQLWRTNEYLPKSPPATTTNSRKCSWRMWDACVKTCQKETKQDDPDTIEDNSKKENPWLSYNIMQDLILLENQVQFIVLEDLYKSACLDLPMNQQNEDNSFLRLVHKYFSHFWQGSGLIRSSDYEEIFLAPGKKKEVKVKVKVKYFTDFLRYFLLPQHPKQGRSFDSVPSATKLSEAGVEFKGYRVSNSRTKRLLDITFQKSPLLDKCPFLDMSWLLSCFPCFRHFKCLESMQAILKLSSFIIGDATECAVRNLMALRAVSLSTGSLHV